MTPTADLLTTAYRRAFEAAELLVTAYRTGRRDGGYIRWSDVDRAHAVARDAATLAARHRRLGRRRPEAANLLPVPVDALAAVVDYLDEAERRDYTATPAAERPGHVYGHVRRLRRWLRATRSAPPLGRATPP